MNVKRTQSMRDDAHAAATEGWRATERGNTRFVGRSPVEGLTERIRSAKRPRPVDPAKRASEREALKERQAVHRRANTQPYRKPAHDGSYFPHQGPRECARRVRQIASGHLNASSGLAT